MTTDTHNIATQLAALAAQLEAPAKPEIDPKYVVTSEFVEIPASEYKPLTDKLRKAEAKLAKVKAEVEAAKRPLAELMAGAEVLVDADTKQYILESRVSVGQIFDATRFKKENPAEAAKFMRDRYSRNFRLLG